MKLIAQPMKIKCAINHLINLVAGLRLQLPIKKWLIYLLDECQKTFISKEKIKIDFICYLLYTIILYNNEKHNKE